MEKLLSHIITAIVADKKAVTIAADRVDDTITFTVSAAQDDIGKIIGKDGRTIKAIRSLLRLSEEGQGVWINLEVNPNT